MRVELSEPYASLYRRAYLRRDSTGRGRVDLVNTNTDRTTIAYARYLLEVKIGDFIPKGYEVDHINSDCSDDRIENLQILSREDHLVKSALERGGRTVVTLNCPSCKFDFVVEQRMLTAKKKNIFCSRSCNGKYNFSKSSLRKIPDGKYEEIKKLASQGLSGYRIAKLTGVSGNTVLKYMKEFTPVSERASTS